LKLCKSVENNLKYAAEFPRLDHVHIELVEDLGMRIEAVTKSSSPLDRLSKLGDGFLEDGIRFLLSKNGKTPKKW
jgi:hypothetical protein